VLILVHNIYHNKCNNPHNPIKNLLKSKIAIVLKYRISTVFISPKKIEYVITIAIKEVKKVVRLSYIALN